MHSHGLKPWNDDVQEGKAVADALREGAAMDAAKDGTHSN